MKKSKRIILAIAPVLGAALACSGGGDEAQDRDVYKSKEECVKDWSEGDLCEQMNDADERGYDGGGHGYYWGPVYYRGSRSVSYNGRTITSSGTGTPMRPYSISSTSSSSARSSKSSPVSSSSTRTGGFGGRSSSTSSGS